MSNIQEKIESVEDADIKKLLKSIVRQAVEEEKEKILSDINDWLQENEHPDEIHVDFIKDIINRDKYDNSRKN